jgi:hypothetical protein
MEGLFRRAARPAVEPAEYPPDQLGTRPSPRSHERRQCVLLRGACHRAFNLARALSLIADDLGNTREFVEQLPAGLNWTNGGST